MAATFVEKLKGELAKLTYEELKERFSPAQLAEIEHTLLDAKCAEDPLYWAQTWTATEDPHWQKQGLPFIAPFPRKTYFVPLFEAFARCPRLLVAKSREMLTSWCCMVYAMHKAQWSTAEVIVQTSKEEKARRLVEYAFILYRNQADWLKRRHPLKRSATLSLEWENGGRLFGIPGVEDQIRMFHPTVAIFDEMCFLPGAEACWNATNPVAQQMIGISSAAPSWMADMCQR
jgi:hypothetical protein